ncbi:hypothetical protein ACIQ7Q_24850 [Streptomyces sp. NPDC096176]|uniref:hypothetical protein n=1 Tax=Streptomyces sp. NPDC096176 TaxID=3366079 RepID=UPI00380D4307
MASPFLIETLTVDGNHHIVGMTAQRTTGAPHFHVAGYLHPAPLSGLSATTVTRLTKQWADDHAAFQNRDLSDRDFVCVWADGVHPKVRLGQAHLCVCWSCSASAQTAPRS